MAKFIVIDGLDGCGKATQTKLLADRLKSEGKNVVQFSFPDYASDSSAAVKMYLNGEISSNLDELNPYACASFYAVDRYIQYIKKMKRYFEEDDNTIILSDRYLSANIIHQGSKIDSLNKRHKFIKWVYEYECGLLGLPKEDYTLILMLDPITSQKLLSCRYNNDENKKDIHESNLDYLAKCYYRLQDSVGYIRENGIADWDTLKCSDKYNNIYSKEHISNMIYELVKTKFSL